jgi:hypothetical protein
MPPLNKPETGHVSALSPVVRPWRRVVVTGVLLACGGDATEPSPPSSADWPAALPIAFGDTVAVTFEGGADTLRRFRFVAEAMIEYSVFAQTQTDLLELAITDTTSQYLSGLIMAGGTGAPLLAHGTGVLLTVGRPLDLRLRSVGAGQVRILLYREQRLPEHRGVEITLGDTISGERFEHAADIDEFTFANPEGGEFIVFAKLLEETLDENVLVSVYVTETDEMFAHFDVPFGADLEATNGGTMLLPPGTATVRIRPRASTWYPFTGTSGGYLLQVRPIVRAPEATTPIIAVGDTVEGEAIDHVGDVDEFTFSATAGSIFNAFLQPKGVATARLSLATMMPTPEDLLASVEATGADTALLRQASGRFTVNQSGVVTVRITGTRFGGEHNRGPYRFVVAAIDPRPEAVAEALPFPGATEGEAIEILGDVDRYTLTVPVDTTVGLVMRHLPDPPSGLVLEVRTASGGFITSTDFLTDGGRRDALTTAIDPLPLDAGTYRIEVRGSGSTDGYRGSYSLEVYGR